MLYLAFVYSVNLEEKELENNSKAANPNFTCKQELQKKPEPPKAKEEANAYGSNRINYFFLSLFCAISVSISFCVNRKDDVKKQFHLKMFVPI